jgi:signal transduction histidine kinase
MAATIERRIRRTVLGAILITFGVTVASVMVANENLEQSLLEMDLQAERESMLDNARPNEVLVWDTASLKAYYAPRGARLDDRLPTIFQGFPVPFSGEVEIGDATFLVTTDTVRGGAFYLAKDISLFESRENDFYRFLLLLGVAVVLLGIVLARITGKRLVGPLQQLTGQIRDTAPALRMRRVQTQYKDAELQAIAHSFNRFLGELEQYVKREQSLMGLASHELRTPIAVIAGALDVIEQRRAMQGPDRAPLTRMRRAVDEMAANIDVILTLTRRKSTLERRAPIDLLALVQEVTSDLSRHAARASERVIVTRHGHPQITEDAALVKMLLRNLIQNALQHTGGHVRVAITGEGVEIADEGAGLPKAYLAYLTDPQADAGELLTLSGLGLFIVSLIGERLGWLIQVVDTGQPGTTLRIVFASAPPVGGSPTD